MREKKKNMKSADGKRIWPQLKDGFFQKPNLNIARMSVMPS